MRLFEYAITKYDLSTFGVRCKNYVLTPKCL